MSKWGFTIEMYLREPLYKPFFIILTLWEEIIIESIKKLVVSYIVGNLVFLD